MSADNNASSDSDDEDLIERAKKHEPRAWQELLQLYGPLVDWWIARSHIALSDRDDVFQNVFLTVAEKIVDFDLNQQRGTFRGWLRVITRSRVVDHLRQHSRTWTAEGGDESWQLLLNVPDRNDNRDERPEPDQELQQVLTPALTLLRRKVSQTTWKAFWGVTVEGKSTADMADELGITASGVRLAKSRVLRRLRDLLEE